MSNDMAGKTDDQIEGGLRSEQELLDKLDKAIHALKIIKGTNDGIFSRQIAKETLKELGVLK